jgi:hypothetical protein
MVGQYFKRRREAVEIALVGSSGIGLALMTVFLHTTLGYGTRSSCQCVQHEYTESFLYFPCIITQIIPNIHLCSAIGWRLGLQAVTGLVLLTFILGSCYRSASLYHPQRRAILHLKNQRKKVLE